MVFQGLPRPLVHYHFGCTEDGKPDVLASGPYMETLLAHHHHNPPLCHLTSNGIVGSFQSKDTAEVLISSVFAIELWITMIEDYATSLPVFAIAEQPDYVHSRDCDGYALGLIQRGRWLEFRYLNEDQDCRVLVLRQHEMTIGRLQQVVIVFADQTNIYLDGMPIIEDFPNHIDTSSWKDSKLYLFGSEKRPEYASSLNMLSFYQQNITQDDVNRMYTHGIDILNQDAVERKSFTFEAFTPAPLTVLQGSSNNPIQFEMKYDAPFLNETVTNDWYLEIEIVETPSYGKLVDAQDNRTIIQQQRLSPFVEALYLPDETFFNYPNVSFDGTNLHRQAEFFSYRLLVMNNLDMMLASSNIVKNEVIVEHVNHPPEISTTTTTPPIQTTILPPSKGFIGRPKVRIQGIEIIDSIDQDIQAIRVDVWSDHGTITLQNTDIVNFTNCNSQMGSFLAPIDQSWDCHGTGKMDRNMTFMATPSMATIALSDLEYEAFNYNTADEVVISIYDGIGGQCPLNGDPSKSIIGIPCFHSIAKIPIAAISEPRLEESSYPVRFLDLHDFGWADGIFLAFLLLLVCCFGASLRRCIRWLGARGAKIHVNDATDPEDNGVV